MKKFLIIVITGLQTMQMVQAASAAGDDLNKNQNSRAAAGTDRGEMEKLLRTRARAMALMGLGTGESIVGNNALFKMELDIVILAAFEEHKIIPSPGTVPVRPRMSQLRMQHNLKNEIISILQKNDIKHVPFDDVLKESVSQYIKEVKDSMDSDSMRDTYPSVLNNFLASIQRGCAKGGGTSAADVGASSGAGGGSSSGTAAAAGGMGAAGTSSTAPKVSSGTGSGGTTGAASSEDDFAARLRRAFGPKPAGAGAGASAGAGGGSSSAASNAPEVTPAVVASNAPEVIPAAVGEGARVDAESVVARTGAGGGSSSGATAPVNSRAARKAEAAARRAELRAAQDAEDDKILQLLGKDVSKKGNKK